MQESRSALKRVACLQYSFRSRTMGFKANSLQSETGFLRAKTSMRRAEVCGWSQDRRVNCDLGWGLGSGAWFVQEDAQS